MSLNNFLFSQNVLEKTYRRFEECLSRNNQFEPTHVTWKITETCMAVGTRIVPTLDVIMQVKTRQGLLARIETQFSRVIAWDAIVNFINEIASKMKIEFPQISFDDFGICWKCRNRQGVSDELTTFDGLCGNCLYDHTIDHLMIEFGLTPKLVASKRGVNAYTVPNLNPIYTAYQQTCRACNHDLDLDEASIDHIVPQRIGLRRTLISYSDTRLPESGKKGAFLKQLRNEFWPTNIHSAGNLRLLCKSCNSGKRSRLLPFAETLREMALAYRITPTP